MSSVSLFLISLSLVLGFAIADDACYAPPLVYGPACSASQGLVSGCCSQVVYSVEVIGDTNVFCKGTGSPFQGSNCTFGWYDIGIVNSGSFPLGWSSSAGSPAISCYGSPSGSSLTWSYTTQGSSLYCPLYCKTTSPCSDKTCICNNAQAVEAKSNYGLTKDTTHVIG